MLKDKKKFIIRLSQRKDGKNVGGEEPDKLKCFFYYVSGIDRSKKELKYRGCPGGAEPYVFTSRVVAERYFNYEHDYQYSTHIKESPYLLELLEIY